MPGEAGLELEQAEALGVQRPRGLEILLEGGIRRARS